MDGVNNISCDTLASSRLTCLSYYIWSPQASASRPLLLVPSSQVDELLNQINKAIKGSALSLVEFAKRDTGISIAFPYGYASLRPRYLGRCSAREQFDSLCNICPGEGYLPPGELADRKNSPSYQDHANECRMKIGLAHDATPTIKKSKAGKEQSRLNKEQLSEHGLLQLERFFGLRLPKYSGMWHAARLNFVC